MGRYCCKINYDYDNKTGCDSHKRSEFNNQIPNNCCANCINYKNSITLIEVKKL